MRVLADTNILLRWIELHSPEYPLVSAALQAVQSAGHRLVISPQNVVEFWQVATRPIAANGLGFDLATADSAARSIESVFTLVEDTPAIHHAWRRLVTQIPIRGRQVFDARLAAVMTVHGIRHILTFDTADFARYPSLTAVHPRDVAAIP